MYLCLCLVAKSEFTVSLHERKQRNYFLQHAGTPASTGRSSAWKLENLTVPYLENIVYPTSQARDAILNAQTKLKLAKGASSDRVSPLTPTEVQYVNDVRLLTVLAY